MKIFEFTNSFIVLDDIRGVIIEVAPYQNGHLMTKNNSNEKWFIRIVFRDTDELIVGYETRGAAWQAYKNLMMEMRG